jgi:iron only hydrogenase large subunit-like protein
MRKHARTHVHTQAAVPEQLYEDVLCGLTTRELKAMLSERGLDCAVQAALEKGELARALVSVCVRV